MSNPVLPGHALHPAAQAVYNVAQLAVVHVHAALPGDLLHVNAQGIALLDVVVQHRGQQIIGCANGVEVPGEVEVDVLHRHHLGIAARSGPPFRPKTGPREGSAGHHGFLADLSQAVGQAHGGGGFPPRQGWGDGGDQDQLAVRSWWSWKNLVSILAL